MFNWLCFCTLQIYNWFLKKTLKQKAFVNIISLFSNVYVPHKTSLHRWSSFQISNLLKMHICAREPLSNPGNVLCAVYLPCYRTPSPSTQLSSPSGILRLGWWKRLPGSCANELALLLNDVCKLWPSLLPVYGAATQNPHRQLAAAPALRSGVKTSSRSEGWKVTYSIYSSLVPPCGPYRKQHHWSFFLCLFLQQCLKLFSFIIIHFYSKLLLNSNISRTNEYSV